MNLQLRRWAPILLALAAIALFVSIRASSADPSVPTAPAPAGATPAYYTSDEIEAAKARGEVLPDPAAAKLRR